MRIAVVIPAFNEAATIADVAGRALRYARRVYVIDDGSEDGTGSQLAELPVTLISNETNLGKAASMARGFAAALAESMDAVITLDADGQHRPEDIPRLVEAAEQYPGDIIIATRLEERGRMPLARRFGNWQADFWISWAAGYPIRDTQSGYRLYPATLLEHLELPAGRGDSFVFESEVLIEAARFGCYARPIAIEAIYTEDLRESHYRAGADTLRIMRMVAGKLLTSGLSPLGLLRALGILAHPGTARPEAGADGSDSPS
jgi:glycosyltransferase involved in cell wall biosynthesis